MGIVHETGHARYEQGLPKHLQANLLVKLAPWVFMNLNRYSLRCKAAAIRSLGT